MPAPARDTRGPSDALLRAQLLGAFAITLGDKTGGSWRRPAAKRLCEIVLLSPGRRISREAACESLFGNLAPAAAARALSQALSLSRAALAPLGGEAAGLLRADRTHIWADPASGLVVDLDLVEERLRSALEAEPGLGRDAQLMLALADEGTLLEDEPLAEWAVRPRERLEWARQQARLVLARDRARGLGRSSPDEVVKGWEACLAADPTCEEAASALMRVHFAQGRQALVEATFERCCSALERLGLRISPALEQVHQASTSAAPLSRRRPAEGPPGSAPVRQREERRLVSVVFAELTGPVGSGERLGPEDFRELVGGALAEVVAQVEAFGGTVTAVSGAGLVAIFGAPESHEDDPERALRAAFGVLRSAGTRREGLSVRAGVETGPAVVGPFLGAGGHHYGAVGEVVGTAAALQSVARPASVLVGPVTRAATEGSFEWGPTEDVATSADAKPLRACYLQRPKARPSGRAGRGRLAGSAPLVGRRSELAVLGEVLREATAGRGGVVLVVGEPGLGKTRLVHECRKLFMAWVGAASGRLPLWLEGRAASYASSVPYGLYSQLLSAWMGVAPEEGEASVRAALERAMRAVFAGKAHDAEVGLLSQVMGFGPGRKGPALARLTPEQLQRATFEALREVVSRLVDHGPTVLVLEDLHWADATSLRLTEELSALTSERPLMLVVTRRPEPDPGVSAMEAALGAIPGLRVLKLELSPLAQGAERELARALLGEAASDEIVDSVSQGAEGNPLFMEERLASLLETRTLVRDNAGWHLDHNAPAELPDALERLVRSRVDRLAPEPHDAIVAASVLGPEFGLDALRAVADLDGGLDGAISDLCSGGLLVELRKLPEPTYRFRHGLIQEATYSGLLRGERRRLHARAAWGLEEASAGQLEGVAAVLGHHFAMAGEIDRAVHYLELAGDNAAAAYANDEAVASYRYGLAVVDRKSDERAGPCGELRATTAVELRAKLAAVFLLTGRHAEAREALEEALGFANPDDRIQMARLRVLLGSVETADHRYDAALAAFDSADDLLGEHPEDKGQAAVDLWLEVQLGGRAFVHYWRNEPEKAAAALAAARPVVEARGTPEQRYTYFQSFVMQRMRETRYLIDEETLINVRAAAAAAQEAGREGSIAWAHFLQGFCQLWHGDLAVARENMEAALAIVDRIGDTVLRARCLCYLNVAALRRHDVGAVRSLAPQAMAAAYAASYPEYVAAAKATLAWVAWQDDRSEDVVALAEEALEVWGATVVSYSWYWLCLWPLVAVHLAGGRAYQAIEAARQLLPPPQQRLPDELESLVKTAVASWENGEQHLAGERLGEALELARRLGYA